MARILIGGPQGDKKDIHDDLVARLQQDHTITYIKNDGGSMFWELAKTPLIPDEERYKLVVYDSGLFYPAAIPEKKIEVFEMLTATYLAGAKAPVLILAETDLAAILRPLAEKAGFMQIDQPYQADEVINKINEILGTGLSSDLK